jgi:hypothetical protein
MTDLYMISFWLQMDLCPDEILFSIMKYLPYEDVLTCQQLNSDFNSLSNDNYLWYELFVRDFYAHKYDGDVNYKEEYKEVHKFIQSKHELELNEKSLSIWRYYIHSNTLHRFRNGSSLLFYVPLELSKLLLQTIDDPKAYCLLQNIYETLRYIVLKQ